MLLLIALVLFVVASVGGNGRVNFTAFGLAFLTAAMLVQEGVVG